MELRSCPTTTIATPEVVENIPLQDAVKEAWQKRPEIYQADLNLKERGNRSKGHEERSFACAECVCAIQRARFIGKFPGFDLYDSHITAADSERADC